MPILLTGHEAFSTYCGMWQSLHVVNIQGMDSKHEDEVGSGDAGSTVTTSSHARTSSCGNL